MNVWKILRPPLMAGTLLAGQMARAIFREDLPSLTNQDPSGVFGSPDSPPLRIVFLGDSSVTSPGVEPLDHSWPRQMAKHLAIRYRVEAISVAVGGSKVRDVLAEQVDAALEARPDIAYVAVGSNDALRGTPVARFESDFNRVVADLHDSVPAVGLSGIGDLGTIPRLPELARGVARVRARAIDHAIARVAARYPRTVKSNAWDVMATFAQRPEHFADDLFHASAQGHLAFARVGVPMVDRLVEVLEEKKFTVHGSQSKRFTWSEGADSEP
ncbi:MAG: GDSL-type esterase/lipase family protein [Acidimicrobiia bacterium]